MRAAYEKGYKVVTLVDCTASTSLEAQVLWCSCRQQIYHIVVGCRVWNRIAMILSSYDDIIWVNVRMYVQWAPSIFSSIFYTIHRLATSNILCVHAYIHTCIHTYIHKPHYTLHWTLTYNHMHTIGCGGEIHFPHVFSPHEVRKLPAESGVIKSNDIDITPIANLT